MYFTQEEIDKLITDDVPYDDLTTRILGLTGNCKIEFIARQDLVVCATEEAKGILNSWDITVKEFVLSGTFLKKSDIVLKATGDIRNIHKCYKVCFNLLEHASGIATKTKNFVDLAKSVNPNIRVATTRKTFPFAKKILIKAILSGGASIHRLGLSETILIFKEHIMFMGRLDNFIKNFDKIKRLAYDKVVSVEAENLDEAVKLVRTGVEFIQLDKFNLEQTRQALITLKNINANIHIAAAGGINDKNVVDYAKTGIDSIVTSWLYFSKSADIGVKFKKLDW